MQEVEETPCWRTGGAQQGSVNPGWASAMIRPRPAYWLSSPVCALVPRRRLAGRYVNLKVVSVLMPGVSWVEHRSERLGGQRARVRYPSRRTLAWRLASRIAGPSTNG